MYISWQESEEQPADVALIWEINQGKKTVMHHAWPLPHPYTQSCHATDPTKYTHSNQLEYGTASLIFDVQCQVYQVGIPILMPRSWEVCWGRCCWTSGQGLWSWEWWGLACAASAPSSQLHYHCRQQSWSGADHCDTAQPARFKSFLSPYIYVQWACK